MIWNAASGSVVEEDTHLGTQPLAAYLGGALFFEHQDWLGTERLLTDPRHIAIFLAATDRPVETHLDFSTSADKPS